VYEKVLKIAAIFLKTMKDGLHLSVTFKSV